MKIYSIGRDIDCNIVIDDRTDVVSRRHATLHVSPWGKMSIVDHSHNGTYVNGIRINSNVPVPVSRKDNISFAHIARLDWNMVSRVYNPFLYVGAALIALLLLFLIIWSVKALITPSGLDGPKPVVMTSEQMKHQQDSIRDATVKQITAEQERRRVNDSIETVIAAQKVKEKMDSLKRVKSNTPSKPKSGTKKAATPSEKVGETITTTRKDF